MQKILRWMSAALVACVAPFLLIACAQQEQQQKKPVDQASPAKAEVQKPRGPAGGKGTVPDNMRDRVK